MDLFNKKRVKQLEEQINLLNTKLEELKLTKEELVVVDLKSQISTLNSEIEEKSKNTKQLQETIHNQTDTIGILNKNISIREDILGKINEIKSYEELISEKDSILSQLKNETDSYISKISLADEKISQERDFQSRLKNLESLIQIINEKKSTLIDLDEIEEYQCYGFYNPKYNFQNSEGYKQKLESIRQEQKSLVKDKLATIHSTDWVMDNDAKRGKEFILDTIKLSLRAFNNECDNIITKVKTSNVDASIKRINTIYEQINKLTDMQRVSITPYYRDLKIEELMLKYEFECKRQEELEEQRLIKERMREEAKALKEIEQAKKKVEKEETHFKNAIDDINNKLEASTDKDKEKLLKKLEELENKLSEIEKIKEDVTNRERNTRAGYVYIISNIGSFGEDIYKIGMTRRLEPMDRVRELGDASVPFSFDVHAMIFSEDAPSLENALHKKFETNSVNKVNLRKEFFKVSLKAIEEEVIKNHNAVVYFTKIAEASEYRQSLLIENNTVAS